MMRDEVQRRHRRGRGLAGVLGAAVLVLASPESPAEAAPSGIDGLDPAQHAEYDQAAAEQLARNPGGVRVGDAIVYEDGDVVLHLSPRGPNDCPGGIFRRNHVCLWEHVDFRGRMLQWRSPEGWVNLTSFGFNDKASSWRNRRDDDARIAEHINGGGTKICLPPNSLSRALNSFNDRASSIALYDSANVC